MKRITLILLACIYFPLLGKAQYGGTFTSGITVNNLEIGQKYTQNEVITALGSPTLYRSYMSEFGLDETYQYQNSIFYFSENGMLTGIVIKSADFLVCEQDNGGIRVGDSINKITELGINGTLQGPPNSISRIPQPQRDPNITLRPDFDRNIDEILEIQQSAQPSGTYELWMNDEVMIFGVENGLIISISYSSSL